MVKELSLNDVMESKVYVKPNTSVTFGSPKKYLEPFIEPMLKSNSAISFSVKASEPVVNAEEEGKMNIAYPRVLVEANLGNLIDGFDAVIGMLYALDLQKPVIKVYSGFNAKACLNLTIFDSSRLFQQELLNDINKVYARSEEFFQEKENELLTFKNTLTKLQQSELTENTLNELIGKLIRESAKTRLGTTPVLQASKFLDDNGSNYYVRPDGKFSCSKFNVYNAVTQALTNSNDITDRANKTIQLANIILN